MKTLLSLVLGACVGVVVLWITKAIGAPFFVGLAAVILVCVLLGILIGTLT